MSEGSDVLVVNPGAPSDAGPDRVPSNGRHDAEHRHENPDVVFLLGMLALKDGRHEAAVELLRRAVALDGGKADHHHALGAAYRAAGRPDRAAACYREALRLRPDSAEVHHDLANLHAEGGDLESAIVGFRRAVAIRPDLAAAHFNLAMLLRRRMDLDGAAAALEAALRAVPDFVEAARDLGHIRARQGRLDAAVDAYRLVLGRRPDDFEVHNELGIVLARLRRYAEAEASYRQAIRLRPDYPDAHNNLGNALRNQGQLEKALVSLREALRLRPNYPEAYNNVGIVLKHLGKLNEAVASYEQALRLRSDYPEAHNNLGLALAGRGKLEAAVVSYQQAVRLKPDYAEACANLADALAGLGRLAEAAAGYQQALALRPTDPRLHKCLGNALARMDKFPEAEASYREAIRRAPAYAEAINDLGIAHARQNRLDDAIASYRRAIEVKPSFVEALNNLGNALRSAGRFEESLECYRRALEQKPNYADAHNNLGIAYAEQGRFDEAVASYTQCLKLRPDHVDAHMNRALTWLRKGDYAQGWAEYEWRWKKRSLTNRPPIMPQWNGFPLAGRRILLFTEQGLGDTIQFVRFCNVLKRQGAGAVILECPEVLVPVLSRTPGIDHLVPQGQPLPDYDVYCPLMNVPGLTATSVESIPAEVPYVFADPELLESWRRELAGIAELKVGINWQGNPKYAGDRHRSIPLAAFEPLARVPGVRLYSIQQLHGLDQLEALKGRFPVTDLGSRLNRTTGPFLDSAAVMRNLDLLITCDSSPAHLAGALGAPVWMAISSTPDWRWLSHREDTPWYPSLRIFRQAERFVWGPVFERMAAELRAMARARAASVTVRIAPAELIDRITTLQVKAERVVDPRDLGDVRQELAELIDARDRTFLDMASIENLTSELRAVHEALWTIEERIRQCERIGDFGPEFVDLARSMYRDNDRRAALKRRIDARLRSELVEEKSYAAC